MKTHLKQAIGGRGELCKITPVATRPADHITSSADASTMPSSQKLTFVSLSNGERLPMLIEASGLPNWYATVYITNQARNTSQAPNTLHAKLAAVRSLLAWADSQVIDLEERFSKRQFLGDAEIESLRAFSQSRFSQAAPGDAKVAVISRRSEGARARLQSAIDRVSSSTQYIRLTYMADYLDWLAVRLVEGGAQDAHGETLDRIRRMTRTIRLHRPRKAGPSRVSARKGLSEEVQERLTTLVQSGTPFTSKLALRQRNELIILLLVHLGIRAGELLSLKVSDFDFQRNEVVIPRRHGDATDPRRDQPVAKTMDRRIVLSNSLATAVSNYVMTVRRQFPAAKRHAFLIVTHQDGPYQGMPLSKKGLAKVFTAIQRAEPQLLGDFTAHVLRHTANDKFSELMDADNVPEAQEEKMRSYMMGWKEGSGTAAAYTRRHTEKKAREAWLKLQVGWHRKDANEKP